MRAALLALLALTFAGCSAPSWLSPHKIEIQQGNFVSQEMVAKLKPGMSKSQVRFALGTPLLIDAFHADRWDYIYVLQKGGKVREKRTVTVVFVDDKLQRLEGDVVGVRAESGAEAGNQVSAPAPSLEPAPAAEPLPLPQDSQGSN